MGVGVCGFREDPCGLCSFWFISPRLSSTAAPYRHKMHTPLSLSILRCWLLAVLALNCSSSSVVGPQSVSPPPQPGGAEMVFWCSFSEPPMTNPFACSHPPCCWGDRLQGWNQNARHGSCAARSRAPVGVGLVSQISKAGQQAGNSGRTSCYGLEAELPFFQETSVWL